MIRLRAIWWSVLAWLAVWAAWLSATPSFHANWTLATIATTAMVGSFATVSYLNLLVFVPRHWRVGRPVGYWSILLASMIGATLAALAIIRLFYTVVFGPFPVKPWYVDYGIDLLLMVLQVAGPRP